MLVVITARAKRDFIQIGRHIAKDNFPRAMSFVTELEAACLELKDMAKAFEVVGRRRNQDIRRRPYGNYVILYRIKESRVDVLRIFHDAQDYMSIVFPEHR